MREPGYYWVKWIDDEQWCVAEYVYNGDYWFVTGQKIVFDSDQFSEINETRIKTPDEQA